MLKIDKHLRHHQQGHFKLYLLLSGLAAQSFFVLEDHDPVISEFP
jgi:hypothetical protein